MARPHGGDDRLHRWRQIRGLGAWRGHARLGQSAVRRRGRAGARRERDDGGGDRRADSGDERRARLRPRIPAGGARDLRSERRGTDIRRGTVRRRALRRIYGGRVVRRRARRAHAGEGTRLGTPGRRGGRRT